MTVAILATSGMERRDLLIATAKLQLFQVRKVFVAIKSGMALPIREKSGMANATPAIPLLPPLTVHLSLPLAAQ